MYGEDVRINVMVTTYMKAISWYSCEERQYPTQTMTSHTSLYCYHLPPLLLVQYANHYNKKRNNGGHL